VSSLLSVFFFFFLSSRIIFCFVSFPRNAPNVPVNMISLVDRMNETSLRSIVTVQIASLESFSTLGARTNVLGFELVVESLPSNALTERVFPGAFMFAEATWSSSTLCAGSKVIRFAVASSVSQPLPSERQLMSIWLRFLLVATSSFNSTGLAAGVPVISPELLLLDELSREEIVLRLARYESELIAVTSSGGPLGLVNELSLTLLNRARSYKNGLSQSVNVSCFDFELGNDLLDGMSMSLCHRNFFFPPTSTDTSTSTDSGTIKPIEDVITITTESQATGSAESSMFVVQVVAAVVVSVGGVGLAMLGVVALILWRRRKSSVAAAAAANVQDWVRESFSSEVADSSLGDRPATSSLEEGGTGERRKGETSSVDEDESRMNSVQQLFMANAIVLNSEPSQKDTESLD
jgi:hypothetical protein